MSDQLEGAGFDLYHAFLLLDGSGRMKDKEQQSGKPKHLAVAEMVQKLINELHDRPDINNTQLTVVCYDGVSVDDIRLRDYDVKANMHYNQANLDIWDPLRGHGGTTPIGRALEVGRELAERWVNDAQGMENRRGVIYLLSDGMVFPDTESNGMGERQKIKDFNEEQTKSGSAKGRIRIATVGYYQFPEGGSPEEDAGRELLKNLPDNPRAFFQTANASEITDYIVKTIAAAR